MLILPLIGIELTRTEAWKAIQQGDRCLDTASPSLEQRHVSTRAECSRRSRNCSRVLPQDFRRPAHLRDAGNEGPDRHSYPTLRLRTSVGDGSHCSVQTVTDAHGRMPPVGRAVRTEEGRQGAPRAADPGAMPIVTGAEVESGKARHFPSLLMRIRFRQLFGLSMSGSAPCAICSGTGACRPQPDTLAAHDDIR